MDDDEFINLQDERHRRAEQDRLFDAYLQAQDDLEALQAPQPGETYREKQDRLQRVEEAEKAIRQIETDLLAVQQPIALQPILPLLAGPPSWRTLLSAYAGAQAEAAEGTAAIIAAAAGQVIIDLNAAPRAEPPRVVAMQLLDHHVARGEPLPPIVLEAVGMAMRIDARLVTAQARRTAVLRGDEAGRSSSEIAAELGISARAVRLLRQRSAQEGVEILAHLAGSQGSALRAMRADVAQALGLLDADGRWRPRVMEAVRHGLRDIDGFREAARVEARRRARGWATDDAKAVARALAMDVRKVRRWMDRPSWQFAVMAVGYWLRQGRNADAG